LPLLVVKENKKKKEGKTAGKTVAAMAKDADRMMQM